MAAEDYIDMFAFFDREDIEFCRPPPTTKSFTDIKLVHHTDKAFLITARYKNKMHNFWVPKSISHIRKKSESSMEMIVPEWFVPKYFVKDEDLYT